MLPAASMSRDREIRETIVELSAQFYRMGWASGTGGGLSIKDGDRVYVAPSGVQKERLAPEDLYVLDARGEVVERPANAALRPSACTSR